MYVRKRCCSAVAKIYIFGTGNLDDAAFHLPVACIWLQSVVAALARYSDGSTAPSQNKDVYAHARKTQVRLRVKC